MNFVERVQNGFYKRNLGQMFSYNKMHIKMKTSMNMADEYKEQVLFCELVKNFNIYAHLAYQRNNFLSQRKLWT